MLPKATRKRIEKLINPYRVTHGKGFRLKDFDPGDTGKLDSDQKGEAKELTARGYRFNEEPYDVPVGRLVTINDPDGNIVGLEDRSKGGLAGMDV